ncbi:MAG: CoA transferase [Acetobacteraceae bacterium]
MPLSGIKVLDLTRVLAGPFCTMLLADMGAEVIKIEALPGGDPIRTQGASQNGLSLYFATFNRNKKSLTLNLKSAEGRALFEALVAGADVVVDNFRPGVLDRLGLGRERLRSLKPGLICASISGFGETGPYRDRPAFDFIAQAMSGFMSLNGGADDPPLRSGPIGDLIAGLYAALGIAAALVGRERTGEGDVVTTSLTSGLVSFLSYASSHYFATGDILARTGNDHPITAPYGMFETSNGSIAIAPADETFFVKLVRALGLEEAMEPARIRDQCDAGEKPRMGRTIADRQAEAARQRILDRAAERGGRSVRPRLFGGPGVERSADRRSADGARLRGPPKHGKVRVLGHPVKFADHPCRPPVSVPGLGEHRDEILAGLGLTPAQIADLQARPDCLRSYPFRKEACA